MKSAMMIMIWEQNDPQSKLKTVRKPQSVDVLFRWLFPCKNIITNEGCEGPATPQNYVSLRF